MDKSVSIVGSLLKKPRNVWKEQLFMPKRTHQPKKARRSKVHGFRARMATKGGQDVLKRRRLKGRQELTV